MKKISVLLLCLLITVTAFAADKNIRELRLKNGIPVYYMENQNSKIDAVSISVEGGIAYLAPEYSGLEEMTFEMMTLGSKDYSYDYLQSYVYQTGSSLTVSSGTAQTCLSLVSIDDYFDSGLLILADGFMNPVFSKEEYDKLFVQKQQSVQSMLNEPVSLGYYYAAKVLFENHPYSTSSKVVPESIENLTLPNITEHHKTLLDNRRIKIFAITHKSAELLVEDLNKTIGEIPDQSSELKKIEASPITVNHEPIVLPHEAAQGTGFVFRCYSAPGIKSSEYITFVLANNIYSSVMFNVLRNKYSMCYTPYANMLGGEVNVGYEYLYRVSKLDDVKDQLSEARQIMAEGKTIVTVDENGEYVFTDFDSILEGEKNSLINSIYSNQTTAGGLVCRMMNSVYNYGNPEEGFNTDKKIRQITAQDVQTVFNKYFITDNEMWCAVVGPEDEVKMENALKK